MENPLNLSLRGDLFDDVRFARDVLHSMVNIIVLNKCQKKDKKKSARLPFFSVHPRAFVFADAYNCVDNIDYYSHFGE